MKKYIFVPTGREVSVGDMIIQRQKVLDIDVPARIVIVTEESLPELIKEGLISESKTPEITIQSAVKHIADRIGWKVEHLEKYLDNLYKIYPAAVFSVVLREVAIMLDEKYPDHINKSKEIWTINSTNGKIVKINPHTVKNFRNFAAFRNLEDALKARNIMSAALRDLYGKQKD